MLHMLTQSRWNSLVLVAWGTSRGYYLQLTPPDIGNLYLTCRSPSYVCLNQVPFFFHRHVFFTNMENTSVCLQVACPSLGSKAPCTRLRFVQPVWAFGGAMVTHMVLYVCSKNPFYGAELLVGQLGFTFKPDDVVILVGVKPRRG